MIRGIIFDLDGTLLDRDRTLKDFVQNQYDRITGLHCINKESYVNRFIELDNRGYVWKDRVYQQLTEEFKLDLVWNVLLDDYMTGFQRHCVGFPNLHEILLYLKSNNFKIGMITNGFAEFQRNNIRALSIEEHFDTILISEVEGLRKPDPEIFRRALHRLGLKPEEAAYVGDHPDNDVFASRNVGMKGIWKEDLYYDHNFESDYIVKDLLEIKSFLEGNDA